MGLLSDTQILYLYVDLLWLELVVAVIYLFTRYVIIAFVLTVSLPQGTVS